MFITHEQRSRKLQPQTTFRNFTALHGAMGQLPLYAMTAFPVRLDDCPEMRAACRRWHAASQESQPFGQAACSVQEMYRALSKLEAGPTRLALTLMWLTAARVGCVLQLRKADIEVLLERETIRVTFRHGKSVALRGPYTIFTAIPPAEMAMLQARLAECTAPTDFVISNDMAPRKRMFLMRSALRSVNMNPNLNNRSVRRGALQALASNPDTDVETLMRFAGHTNPSTTRRYLEWGRLFPQEEAAGVAAAAALRPSSQH